MRSLFLSLVLLFAAVAAQAQNGYQIRPGDVLAVEVLEDPALNREVLVLPDGSISFPFADSVFVEGRSTGQVQDQLSTAISRNFTVPPTVFVTVRGVSEPVFTGGPVAAATIEVYFLGEVAAPGPVEIPVGTTFLQGLSFGGGFTNFAAQNRIQLRRNNPHTGEMSVAVFDYRAISRGASLSSDPVLADGDVILVPERRLFE